MPNSNFKLIKETLQNIDFRNQKKKSNLVTLLGYPESKSLEELKSFIKKTSINLNCTYPIIEIEKLKKIPESERTIFVDS